MAKSGEHPHLTEWNRSFAKSVGNSTKDILKTVVPNMASTASSTTSSFRDARTYLAHAKSGMNFQSKSLENTRLGRTAKDILDGAVRDIQTGNFSHNRIMNDSISFLDETVDFDSDLVDNADPAAIAAYETRKNTAILSQVVNEGNVATIDGLKNMTETLSKVTMKSSDASASKIANVALFGMNRISNDMLKLQNTATSINSNLVAMINFQNKNQSIVNQAALQYYDTSSRMLNQIGQSLQDIRDFNEQSRKLSNTKNNRFGSKDTDFLSGGFNVKDYGKFIKKNFNNSMYSMIPMMLGMGGGMGGMGSGSAMNSLLTNALSSVLFPSKVKKSMGGLDKSFSQLTKNSLYKVGDMGDDYTKPFMQFIGSMFGLKRPKVGTANMGDFKKDVMGWNGIAQKTLVEVIPSYLANIEAALTNKQSRHYDMASGQFKSKTQISKEFTDEYNNKLQYGMSTVADKITKQLDKSSLSKSDITKLTSKIDALMNDRISGKRGYDKDYTRDMGKILNSTMPTKDIHDIMLDLEDSIRDTIETVNDFNKSIEDEVGGSKYRNLFNTHGDDQRKSRSNASFFTTNRRFTKTGVSFSSMTDDEIRKYQAEEKANKDLAEKVKSKFSRFKSNRGTHMSNGIDSVNNKMYDASMRMMGLSDDEPKIKAASSRSSNKPNISETDKKINSNLTKNSRTFKQMKDANPEDIAKDAKASADILKDNTVISKDDKNSIKALIGFLYNGVTTPFMNLLGKNGLAKSLFDNEHVKKGIDFLKAKLFNEKDGLFAPLVKDFKDGMDYMKYTFTGKGYTNRKGKSYKDDKNSVLSHLGNGYDFIFKNTMTYMFGDKFAENETYGKYFKWMDVKGKKRKATSTAAKNSTNTNDTGSSKTTKNTSTTKMLTSGNGSSKDLPMVYEEAGTSIAESTAYVSEKIKSDADQFSMTVFGSTDKGATEDTTKKVNESFMSKFKKNLPKSLTAGLVGAGVAASTGGSLGILGSLFLASNPIGGALAGIGIQLLSKSQKFQEFVFGKEDKDGKRSRGLISKSTQTAFKKSLPLIVGAGTLGAVKSLFFSGGVAAATPVGVMMQALLPGGMIGGALLGAGLGILKNSETFNRILFGKTADNPDGHKGIFAKGMSKVTQGMSKSTKFMKGGLKGLGVGILSGATIGNLGILGSALTLGGPVGAGLAGLGIGIASQTRRFQELLFGTKELDKDGNFTGKTLENGLLSRVQSMLSVNVFEPTKTKIQSTMANFAYWAKGKIEYPFRLAFGPILDSLSGLKDSIGDFVKDKFELLSNGIGDLFKDTLKKVFSPLTMIMGKIGKMAIGSVGLAAKATGSIVAAPINMLSMIMSPTRGKEYIKFFKDTAGQAGGAMDILKEHWQEQDEKGAYGTGIKGKLKSFTSKFSDIKTAYGAGKEGYNEGMSVLGKNHLNWRGVGSDKKQNKANGKAEKEMFKQRAAISKLSIGYAKHDKYNKAKVFTDKEFGERQAAYMKVGVNKEWISNQEDLSNLIHNQSDWEDKWKPKTEAGSDASAMIFKETPEQQTARERTEKYQDSTSDWLKGIHDLMMKEANARVEADTHRKGKKKSEKDMKAFNKKLSKAGLKYSDLGINVEDIVDYNSIPEYGWEEYRDSDYYASGDFKTWYKLNRGKYFTGEEVSSAGMDTSNPMEAPNTSSSISNVLTPEDIFKQKLKSNFAKNTQNADNDPNIIDSTYTDVTGSNNLEKSLSVIASNTSKIAKETSTTAKAVIQGNEIASDGAFNTADFLKDDNITDAESETSLGSVRTKKTKSTLATMSSFVSSFFGKKKKDEAEIADVNKEATETTASRGLHGKVTSIFSKVANSNAVTKGKEKATSLLGSISGLLGSVFNGATTFLADSGNWGKFGLTALVAYMFKDKLAVLIPTLTDKLTGFLDKYLEPTLDKVGDFIGVYGPKLIEGASETITVLMPALIKSAFKIVGSVASTFLGMGADALGIGKSGDKTVSNDAAAVLEQSGTNTIDNGDGTSTVLGSRTAMNADGTTSKVKNPTVPGRVARLGFNMLTKPKTAVAVGKTLMGAATLPLYLLPGGKNIAKIATTAAGKLTGAASKGISAGASSLFSKITKKTASTGSAVIAGKAADKLVTSDSITKVTTWISGLVKKFSALADNKKIDGAVGNKVFGKIASGFATLMDKIVKKLTKENAPKIAAKVADATQAAIKGGSKLIPVIGWVMIGYDAVSGALEADKLFGVPSDEVDWAMRTISSLFKVILGLGIGPLFDIAMSIGSEILNEDCKQNFATMAYKAVMTIAGNDKAIESLDENQENLKMEVDNYNEANKTNISQTAYKDLKNKTWYQKAWGKITGSGDKTDYSQYEPANYKSTSTTSTKTTVTTIGNGRGSIGNGRGNAVGYGILGQKQGDSRWANYKLGKFPDGSTSTMATGGCGPTALASITNSNPLAIAQLAKANGYLSDGGANENLFTDGAGKLGLSAKKVSSSSLKNNLQNGKPVIIAGKGSGSGTPYTSAGHILAATGIDSKGNVTIADPEYGGSRKVNISNLTNGMTNAWSYSKAAGYGRNDIRTLSLSDADQSASSITYTGKKYNSTPKPSMTEAQIIAMQSSPNRIATKSSKDGAILTTRGGIAYTGNKKSVGNSNFVFKSGFTRLPNGTLVPSSMVLTLDKYYKGMGLPTMSDLIKTGDSAAINAMLAEFNTDGLGSSYLADNNVFYKNGAPFYKQTDSRWAGLPWRGSTVGNKGDDLSSLAMLFSAYANTGLSPDYIASNWLETHPEWYNAKTGLNDTIFDSNTGAVSQMETHPNSTARLQIKKASSTNEILEAMKNRRLVYMNGYQYNDSVFGGIGSANSISANKSPLHSVIGTYAKNGLVAINDPTTDPYSTSIFPTSALTNKVGANNSTDVVKNAWILSNSDNTGLSGNIDVSSMTLPTSQYTAPGGDASLLSTITTNLGNFMAIAENWAKSLFTGKAYKSIFDTTLENSGDDSLVGNGRGSIGYGSTNPVKDYLAKMFGMSTASSSSTTTDDGIKPTGYSTQFGDYIGKYVAPFESGTRGPVSVSGGNGDRGGASFGTYQLASFGKAKATGNLQAFWDQYYKNKYPNVVPGANSQFIETWKSEARANTTQFHNNEQSFMGRKYYTPQKNYLRGVLDPDNHSRSAQESVWSSAIQYGPQTAVVKNALGNQDSQAMGVNALINKIQNYKVANVNSNFGSSSASVRNSVANRHNVGERNVLLNIAGLSPLKTGGGTASISSLMSRKGSVGYGTDNADEARVAVKNIMTSFEGKLNYSQDSRNPVNGSADCSSLVEYCYKNGCGLSIGSDTGAQISSGKGTDVDSANASRSYPDESKLKIGDLLFYRGSDSSKAQHVGHVEMYVGNGQILGHGGGEDGNVKGPTRKNLSTYRTTNNGTQYIKARRFISDGSWSAVNDIISANTSDASSASTVSGLFSPLFDGINKVIEKRLGSLGSGAGTSNKSPEAWFTNTLNGQVTGKYGLGYGIGNSFHRGLDIGANYGSPVYTPIGGRVVSNSNDALGYGNNLVIHGDDGNNHIFAHLNNKSPLGLGSRVSAKSAIGNVGSSGNSTGSHLHYEIRKGDSRYTAIDPSSYTYGSETANDNSLSKSQNINRIASGYGNASDYGTGGADTNLNTSDMSRRLNVAVNTTGVENKLDILIGVVKDYIEKGTSSPSTTTNTIVGYGNGLNSKPTVKVVKVESSSSAEATNYSDMSLRNIHKLLGK